MKELFWLSADSLTDAFAGPLRTHFSFPKLPSILKDQPRRPLDQFRVAYPSTKGFPESGFRTSCEMGIRLLGFALPGEGETKFPTVIIAYTSTVARFSKAEFIPSEPAKPSLRRASPPRLR